MALSWDWLPSIPDSWVPAVIGLVGVAAGGLLTQSGHYAQRAHQRHQELQGKAASLVSRVYLLEYNLGSTLQWLSSGQPTTTETGQEKLDMMTKGLNEVAEQGTVLAIRASGPLRTATTQLVQAAYEAYLYFHPTSTESAGENYVQGRQKLDSLYAKRRNLIKVAGRGPVLRRFAGVLEDGWQSHTEELRDEIQKLRS